MNLPASLLPRPLAHGIIWLCLLAVFFLLPLVIVPQAVDSYVLAKRSLLEAASLLLLGGLLAGAWFGRELRILLQPVNALLAAVFLWSLLSILWSHAPSLTQTAAWHLGAVVLFLLVYQSMAAGSRTRLLRLAQALMLSSLVMTIWVLIQDVRSAFAPGSISVRQTLGDWRDYLSTVALGNTSHIGDFLAFGFLAWMGGFLLCRRRRTLVLALVALWLHAAALIVCWSVHSNLSLLLASGFAAWLLFRRGGHALHFRRRGRWAVLVAGWVAVVLFLALDHPANPHGSHVWGEAAEAQYRAAGIAPPEGGFSGGIFSQAFASPRWVAGWETRVAIWLTTLEIIRHHTWLGTGAGTFTHVYPATISGLVQADPALAPYAGSWTNAAHQDLLQAWAELGIPGAFLLVLLVAVSIKQHWERLDALPGPGNRVILSLSLAAIVAICLQSMMNFPLQLPVSLVLFLSLLGVPFLLPARGGEQADLYVPVERHYGPLALGIKMKNMAFPTEFSIRWVGEGRSLAAGGAVIVGALCLGGAWLSLTPLRADIAYREVRELKLRADARGMTASDAEAIFAGAERVLAIWPRHVDCRSAYQDALLEMGRHAQVVEQTPKVLARLNAIEVHERRALALEALGRHDEAMADWDEVFRRRPAYGHRHPAQYEQWLRRREAAGENR